MIVIAEVGINHNGSIEQAQELILAAAGAGATYVKFQAWRKGRWADIEKYRMSYGQLVTLKQSANAVSIDFIATAFDLKSIEALRDLGQTVWKIPSGLITNDRYLCAIADVQPVCVLLSTGMADMDEVKKAQGHFECPVILMHCVTQYPAKVSDLNLSLIGNGFNGYSDHSGKIMPCVVAASRGAMAIEAHLTYDQKAHGPDHAASLDVKSFTAMVKMIRKIGCMLGEPVKKPTDAELKIRDQVRCRMKNI